MEDIAGILLTEIDSASKIISHNKSFKHIIIPEYDCSQLPEIGTNGKDLPDDLIASFFFHLHQYDHSEGNINDFPCIYAFELVEESDRHRVLEAFTKIDGNQIQRKLPALKTLNPENSTFLYVGKVNKFVGNRLVTHLGYYTQKNNHGLQLAHWIKDIFPSIKLRVHIFRFEKEFAPYISAFEMIMARKLKPIIGKHN